MNTIPHPLIHASGMCRRSAKPKPISKAEFKLWLRKQSPTRSFWYMDNSGCMLATFLREARGITDAICGGTYWLDRGGVYSLPDWLVHVLQEKPLTCGHILSLL